MTTRANKKFFALLFAVILLLGNLSAFCLTGSEPQNLLRDSSVSYTVKGVMSRGGAAYNDIRDLTTSDYSGLIPAFTDGNLTDHKDMKVYDDTDYPGLLVDLGGEYSLSQFVTYVGLGTLGVEGLDIFASDSLDTLYQKKIYSISSAPAPENAYTYNSASSIKARYVAFYYTKGSSTYGGFRVCEIEVYGKQISTEDPNLLRSSSISPTVKGVMSRGGASYSNILDLTASDYSSSIGKFTDGNTTEHVDMKTYDDTDYPGLLVDLGKNYDLSKLTSYVGVDALKVEGLDIFASDSLETLYQKKVFTQNTAPSSGNSFEFSPSTAITARYIAFFYTKGSSTYGGYRVCEIEVYGHETQIITPPVSTDKNMLFGESKVPFSIKGVLSRGGSVYNNIIDLTDSYYADLNPSFTDGNTTEHKDMKVFDDTDYPGLIVDLGKSYDLSKFVTYVGVDALKIEGVDLFASDSLDTLYQHKIYSASSAPANGNAFAYSPASAMSARYVAFYYTKGSIAYGGFRVCEVEIYGHETVVPAANVLSGLVGTPVKASKSALSTASAELIPIAINNNSSEGWVNSAKIACLTDGKADDNADSWLDFNSDWAAGMVYDLTDIYSISSVKAMVGLVSYPVETVKVYASETLSLLGTAETLIFEGDGKTTQEKGGSITPVNARYLAYVLTDASGGYRAIEFEAFGSFVKKDDSTNPGTGGTDTTGNVLAKALPKGSGLAIKNGLSSGSIDLSKLQKDVTLKAVRNNSASDIKYLLDGDKTTHLDLYYEEYNGATGDMLGVSYDLGKNFTVKSIAAYLGLTNYEQSALFVYASDSYSNLFSSDKMIYSSVKPVGIPTEINYTLSTPVTARYVAFLVGGDVNKSYGGNFRVKEFEVYVPGEELVGVTPSQDLTDHTNDKYVDSWPSVPSGENILSGKNITVTPIIAPSGDFTAAKQYQYTFVAGDKKASLSALADGNITDHFDIYGFAGGDYPGVLYDLGAYYDLSHVHAFAGIAGSSVYTVNGFAVYAADNLKSLYSQKSLVYSYKNTEDTRGEMGYNISGSSRVRYIAFFFTSTTDGGWRVREIGAYGSKSADQSEVKVAESILAGLDADYYGVAQNETLNDPVYMGGSQLVGALTDGTRDAVEFWGGKENDKTKFVFTYDLYANYDVSAATVFAFADVIEQDSGIHKGIRSAEIYASRTFDTLFDTANKVTVKQGYQSTSVADEESVFTAENAAKWKNVRFISFVFTIGDTRYGACRLEEIQAYGTLSAVQDKIDEENNLPQYIDLETSEGVKARLYQKDSKDDLTKLGALLAAVKITSATDIGKVVKALDENFLINSLYKIKLTDVNGSEVALDGRIIRLSFPLSSKETENISIASVDNFGVELISSSVLNQFIYIETETLRTYALVSPAASKTITAPSTALAVILVIMAAVLAVAGVAAAIVLVLKNKA